MGRLLIGITSWTEKTLVESGGFYPPEAKSPEKRLAYYASRFPVVEVDSSYYAIPTELNAQLWAERTPAEFTFDVKAFRLLTQHQTPVQVLPLDIRERLLDAGKRNIYLRDLPPELVDEVWTRFAASLHPLQAEGKLGAVVFQFPPWFVYRPSNLEYLAECAHRLPQWTIAVEFRNKTWFSDRNRERVLDFEAAHGIAHVVVDEPQGFSTSVPAIWRATTPRLAMVRLHGRNAETWERKDNLTAAQRFDYLYREDELLELVQPIDRLSQQVEQMHVLFNNCRRDYATRNAQSLIGLCAHATRPTSPTGDSPMQTSAGKRD